MDAEENDADVVESARNKRRRHAEDSNTTTHDTKLKYKELHANIIDTFLSKIDERFTEENIKPLIAIHNIITADSRTNTDFKDILIYKDDVDFWALDVELHAWYNYKKMYPAQFDTQKIKQLSQQFVVCHLNEVMPQLFKLLKIYLSIPVTSATGERSFSCLPRVKNYLRNTIGQQRLSDLAVLSIESEQMVNVDIEEVINKFNAEKNRRINFF